jgi:hypothetical protein
MLAQRIGLIAALVAAAAVAGAAPPYDGSKPMQCAIQTVMVCSDATACVRGTAQTVSLPSVIIVNVGQRLISGDATGRTAKVTSVEREGGRLIIHGIETGASWNLAIVENSGDMTSTVLSRAGGFIMFGKCESN